MMKICKEENISGPSVSVVLPPPDFKPPNIIEKGSKVKMTKIMMMMMMMTMMMAMMMMMMTMMMMTIMMIMMTIMIIRTSQHHT